jgi:polyisoprenoid-binding protein YceI
METQNFEIVSAQSNINWIGRKVTGAHNGTIDVKKGALVFDNGILTGGAFTIDTTSIKILDVTDPATNAQFGGHLASEDFFSSEKFPEAEFNVTSATATSATSYHIAGNLTIKGITHALSFDATINANGDTVTASGKIVVDRTKYEMKFRSGNFFANLGDTLIYNDFDLDVNIIAKANAQA